MLSVILPYFVEFAIQAVFLLAALWIMIKLQKLDCHFLGLLGSAALVSALEMILNRFLGTYLSTPIVIVVLCLCVAKVTQAEYIDVVFTVAVGGALVFGMNLWLLGALMGDLRPSAREAEAKRALHDSDAEYQTAARTNRAPALEPATIPVSEKTASMPKPGAVISSTNPATPALVKPGEAIAKDFVFKALSRNSTNSSIMFDTGTRIYTLILGESRPLETPQGVVMVHFDELGEDWVALTVAGEPVKLSLRGPTMISPARSAKTAP
jgi:hypothetical protein